jgi:hypothetical protein
VGNVSVGILVGFSVGAHDGIFVVLKDVGVIVGSQNKKNNLLLLLSNHLRN